MVASSSAGFFQLDLAQGQAVDEEHRVRPAGALVLDDSELVDSQPVVGARMFEVNSTDLCATDSAVGNGIFHRHSVNEHAVELAIAEFKGCAFGPS